MCVCEGRAGARCDQGPVDVRGGGSGRQRAACMEPSGRPAGAQHATGRTPPASAPEAAGGKGGGLQAPLAHALGQLRGRWEGAGGGRRVRQGWGALFFAPPMLRMPPRLQQSHHPTCAEPGEQEDTAKEPAGHAPPLQKSGPCRPAGGCRQSSRCLRPPPPPWPAQGCRAAGESSQAESSCAKPSQAKPRGWDARALTAPSGAQRPHAGGPPADPEAQPGPCHHGHQRQRRTGMPLDSCTISPTLSPSGALAFGIFPIMSGLAWPAQRRGGASTPAWGTRRAPCTPSHHVYGLARHTAEHGRRHPKTGALSPATSPAQPRYLACIFLSP